MQLLLWVDFRCTTLTLLADFGLVYLLSLVFSREFSTQAIEIEFEPQLRIARMLFMAILALTAIATRGVDAARAGPDTADHFRFLPPGASLGLDLRTASRRDHGLGGQEDAATEEGAEAVPVVLEGGERIQYALLNLGHMITPNFQIFWLRTRSTRKRDPDGVHRIHTALWSAPDRRGSVTRGDPVSAAGVDLDLHDVSSTPQRRTQSRRLRAIGPMLRISMMPTGKHKVITTEIDPDGKRFHLLDIELGIPFENVCLSRSDSARRVSRADSASCASR